MVDREPGLGVQRAVEIDHLPGSLTEQRCDQSAEGRGRGSLVPDGMSQPLREGGREIRADETGVMPDVHDTRDALVAQEPDDDLGDVRMRTPRDGERLGQRIAQRTVGTRGVCDDGEQQVLDEETRGDDRGGDAGCGDPADKGHDRGALRSLQRRLRLVDDLAARGDHHSSRACPFDRRDESLCLAKENVGRPHGEMHEDTLGSGVGRGQGIGVGQVHRHRPDTVRDRVRVADSSRRIGAGSEESSENGRALGAGGAVYENGHAPISACDAPVTSTALMSILSSMSESDLPECGVDRFLLLFDGPWATLIVRELMHGPHRFGELRDALPGISAHTLTSRLRLFERRGIVTRTAYAEIPPRVVYELTDLGQQLRPVLDAMYEWGMNAPLSAFTAGDAKASVA